MELTGTIERIEQEKQVTDKFKKREFVIMTDKNTDYPQSIQLECTQANCDILDNFTVGQDVTVQINLRGRNWTNPEGIVKTFNTLQAWKIEALTASEPIGEIPVSAVVVEPEPTDDLPF